MPTTRIRVYSSRYGKYLTGARVVLGWMSGFNAGQSQPQQTDSNGEVIIYHSSTGEATVYVDGQHVATIRTPCVAEVRV